MIVYILGKCLSHERDRSMKRIAALLIAGILLASLLATAAAEA